MSEFSRSLGVSSPTVRRWLSVLEASYQIFLLPPHHQNLGKRIVKSPKLYFLDTALATYLIGLHDKEPLINGPVIGQLFETMVVSEIIKMFHHRGEKPNIYYWRTKTGEEVDLLIERNMKRYGMEMKSASTIYPGHLTPLLKWRDLSASDDVFCILVYGGEESFTLNNVHVHPWYLSPDILC